MKDFQQWKARFWCSLIGIFLLGPLGALIGFGVGYVLDNKKGSRISGKAWGGILGLMFAGPLGAIAGVYLGHSMDKGKETVDEKSMFQINLLSILSYVAKVDGHIDPREVQTIIEIFRQFGYGSHQISTIQRTLEFALKQDIDLKETCENFSKASRYEERLMLLRVVYLVAKADGVIHSSEKIAIEEIVSYLKISEDDYMSLQGAFGKSDDRYYQILGLKRGVIKSEVKRAYRKLALKHHPDRVAHLGEEYKKIATEDFKKISEAYEKVLQEF